MARKASALITQDDKAIITLIRQAPRMLDSDNLPAALKHVRDGIADALWPNISLRKRDDHEGVEWVYKQEKAPTYAVVCEINICPKSTS